MQALKWSKPYGFSRLFDVGNSVLPSIGLAFIKAEKGSRYNYESGLKEACLVILSGRWRVATPSDSQEYLFQRSSVFEQKPSALYCPARCFLNLYAEDHGELAICESWGEKAAPGTCVAIAPDMVSVIDHGADNYKRKAYEILGGGIGAARLIVGETISEPGNWSSFPPHKHDIDNLPQESQMEEVYYFKLQPPDGFGFQRVYTDDLSLNETYLIQENSIVTIPRGYHPVVSAPGYAHYYLWVLSGDKRILRPYFDPRYEHFRP